jgi:glycosyltransferase involved in cell wall biosynthesis
MDRAWRCRREDAAILAPLYGRLLMLEARDHEAALLLLRRAIDFAPDPDVAALIALALLRLERPEQARRQLETALATYCAASGGLLFQVAGEFMRDPAMEALGWFGRGPTLELVGELSDDNTATALEIRLDGQPAFTQLLRYAPAGRRRRFSFDLPQRSLAARIDVTSRGIALLGSGGRPPGDFGIDGRTLTRGRRVTGWVRLGWLPTRAVRLRIDDETGHHQALRAPRLPLPGWRWPIEFDSRSAGLRGARIQISARMPDGRWKALPDSPLLLEPAVRLARRKTQRLSAWSARSARPHLGRALSQNARRTDVIIAVTGGREETLACIDAVLATLDALTQVVVVDDAMSDHELANALDALSGTGRITLLRNTASQGFGISVNRALALHPAHDALLLSSGTWVFDDWLSRLRAAAYSGATVGTVTPFSNDGSIASYLRASELTIDIEDGAHLHALTASTHSGARAPIPVGGEVCLFMRRDCLQRVGPFDAAIFGVGPGHASDFSLRARAQGWSHLLAADVYVHHAASESIGGSGAAMQDRTQRLLNLRYPGYDRFIESFLQQDPLHALRRRLDERRLSTLAERFVLLVTLALTGGVDRFVAERCERLRERGLFPLVLRPAEAGSARRCELWTDAIEVPNLQYDIPSELPALTALLGAVQLEAIELQHFLHLDARVIDAVRALPLPYDVYVHDYAWICPRVTLIDGSGRYCGEPAVKVCQSCVRRHGSNLGETLSVPALRARSDRWLRGARRVIAPSADAAARLQRHFVDLKVAVEPHTKTIVPIALPPRTEPRATVRVVLMGAIGEHKGYRILLECARDARARRLPLEYVVIGYTENDAPLLATCKVFITGHYTEAEVAHLLRREQADVAWLPSVWPETWSYTLDYALGTGLPVVAFDLGAIAERLRAAGVGVLLPLDLKPARINDRLLQLAGLSHDGAIGPRFAETELAHRRDGATMAATHAAEMLMNKAPEGKPAQTVHEEGLSASVQVLPLPPGLYLFTVKASAPPAARAAGQLALPALHVGLGPGVRSEQVEFIEGPSTQGAWLFAQSDLLVIKVNSPGTTLVLTSVRAPGGEVLSIKVERLDARTEVMTTPARQTPPAPTRSPAAAAHVDSAPVAVRTAIPPPNSPEASPSSVPIEIRAHIRSRGDMSFADVAWAGRVAPGLWVESFSVRPLERLAATDIEYKGLTVTGFETPWLSDEKMCGTQGMAVPLVGFALRLKPTPASAAYDCEYSGYFQSGQTVGPVRNGAPCRSTVANDPLEGIQVRLVKRSSTSQSIAATAGVGRMTAASIESKAASAKHPSAGGSRPGNSKAARAEAKRKRRLTSVKPAAERPMPASGSLSRSTRSRRRHTTRRP